MTAKRFEMLLEPGRIGPVVTKNRMVKSGAAARYWGRGEDQVSDRIKHYYEAFARGGIGLLIVEGPLIEPVEERMNGNYRLDDDNYIKGVAELTSLLHSHGCPTFVQLNHTANWQKTMPWRPPPAVPPEQPRGASPVCIKSIMDNNNEMPREITAGELLEIVDNIGVLAVRLEKAGFDGIEINAASTHLFHSFLSPFWNKRHDAYGCDSLENRTRFLVQTIREIKKRLGNDYPVSIIINGLEMGTLIGVENSECLTLEDAVGIARILEAAGADAVEARSQWLGRHDASFLTDHFYYPEPPVPPRNFPEEYYRGRRGAGANMLLSGAIKKRVNIPVMTVGRLDPEIGETILREGKADFICFNRRLIADPELPNKVVAGRLDDIAPCTSCTACKVMSGHRRCRINGATGTEEPYLITPAPRRKKVVVVGGGPGGMEAARAAAVRGHQVVLYEKSYRLGGLMPLAATVKGIEIEDIPAIIRYFKRQLARLGVDVRLGEKADAAVIATERPDAVVIATGGVTVMPDIPGIDGPNVLNTARLHGRLKMLLRLFSPGTLNQLTRIWMPIGRRVVVIGGGIHGCELAEFLAKRGRRVTIVDTAESIGEGMVNHLRFQLLDWLQKKGVTLVTGAREYICINRKGLVVLTAEGYNRTLEADNIIPALPLRADTRLFHELEGRVSELYVVGDCHEPNLIVDAVGEGYKIGKSI
jgi:2,4-dienoyl-CoA reductase (NADPH2)